jgi:hypothetical protein
MQQGSNIKKILKKGLAVDIDETLSWTVGHWVKEMQRLFGNPENLSVKELVDKYTYTYNVPYWQSQEALSWIEEKRRSNEFQKQLPLIKDSNQFLNKIDKIIPIAAYITIRPESVEAGTRHWLEKHNFPQAPIISRPDAIPTSEGNKWKAQVLGELYPKIEGFIDDSPSVIESLPQGYKGKIFFFNQNKIKTKLDLVQCKTWRAIYNQVKNKFPPRK